MADRTTYTDQVVLDLTLSRANVEDENRRLTFDVYDETKLATIKLALVENFIPSLVGGGLSTLIQPSGWRDNDDDEDEYECTMVSGKLVRKTETVLDLGE